MFEHQRINEHTRETITRKIERERLERNPHTYNFSLCPLFGSRAKREAQKVHTFASAQVSHNESFLLHISHARLTVVCTRKYIMHCSCQQLCLFEYDNRCRVQLYIPNNRIANFVFQRMCDFNHGTVTERFGLHHIHEFVRCLH